MPSFSFIPYMVSEKKVFNHFYENRPFLPPRQPIKFTDFDKSHMKRRGLLNKHFCIFFLQYIPNETENIVNFLFSHYKPMGILSCHSNQGSYPTGIKNIFSFPLPIGAICRIWKESASRLQRRCHLKMLTDGRRTDDGRTPDACIYYKLTFEPSAQVS